MEPPPALNPSSSSTRRPRRGKPVRAPSPRCVVTGDEAFADAAVALRGEPAMRGRRVTRGSPTRWPVCAASPRCVVADTVAPIVYLVRTPVRSPLPPSAGDATLPLSS